MAKAVICDKCRKAMAESEILPKEYLESLQRINDNFYVRFIFADHRKQPCDICRKCAVDLILEFGDKIKGYMGEAKKDKVTFSL
jgi:hypothetical protein